MQDSPWDEMKTGEQAHAPCCYWQASTRRSDLAPDVACLTEALWERMPKGERDPNPDARKSECGLKFGEDPTSSLDSSLSASAWLPTGHI